jgi:hypothetical protein
VGYCRAGAATPVGVVWSVRLMNDVKAAIIDEQGGKPTVSLPQRTRRKAE